LGEVPIKAIRTHPLAMMFGLDTKNSGFRRYGSEKGKWVDEDGSVLVRVGFGLDRPRLVRGLVSEALAESRPLPGQELPPGRHHRPVADRRSGLLKRGRVIAARLHVK
jgi:hypothetical protein